VIDSLLDDLVPDIAVALDGPRGVGKTVTGARRCTTVISLDDPVQRQTLAADLSRVRTLPGPVFLDEWQRHPPVWDAVRRAVDDGIGHFVLAGSATPVDATIHSGAGRIVRLRMRPMGLTERALASATVSLADLMTGARRLLRESSPVTLAQYADEIVASGFPGIRRLRTRQRELQLDGYLTTVVERDFESQGRALRRPTALRGWLSAYAAATATIASYSSLLDAATPGQVDKPSKVTAIEFREVLDGLWLLDPVPGWLPTSGALDRLTQAPKHHLADPALAARLLNVDADALLSGRPRQTRGQGSLFGALFESLVTQAVRSVAAAHGWETFHLRTRGGDHEVDLIVEGPERRVLAIEVKLGGSVDDDDVRHLRWLARRLGDDLIDAIVVTTGPEAYRRPDGIGVVPAALIGT
jgi:hypothetical protein